MNDADCSRLFVRFAVETLKARALSTTNDETTPSSSTLMTALQQQQQQLIDMPIPIMVRF